VLDGHSEKTEVVARGQPLEIEILDASKVVQKKDVEVSMAALFLDRVVRASAREASLAGCP